MPPVICIVGKSKSGKTTFLEKLLPALKHRGYRIGVIKHAFHHFDMDTEGKDSWRHKAAGADTVMVATAGRMAMVKDCDHCSLDDCLAFFDDVDLVLTEGFKSGNAPKIEIFRSARNSEPLCRESRDLIAMVTDTDLSPGVPRFGLGDAEAVADFIENMFLKP